MKGHEALPVRWRDIGHDGPQSFDLERRAEDDTTACGPAYERDAVGIRHLERAHERRRRRDVIRLPEAELGGPFTAVLAAKRRREGRPSVTLGPVDAGLHHVAVGVREDAPEPSVDVEDGRVPVPVVRIRQEPGDDEPVGGVGDEVDRKSVV